MIVEAGHYALVLALVLSALQACLPLVGAAAASAIATLRAVARLLCVPETLLQAAQRRRYSILRVACYRVAGRADKSADERRRGGEAARRERRDGGRGGRSGVGGAKGVGESGTSGSLPTVMNAIMNAVRPRGVARLDMPVTPDKLWRALQRATPAKAA